MQIQIEKTLDVEVVERHLAELWRETSGGYDHEDDLAVLRARVANLIVFVARESSVTEAKGIIAELTAIHPSRVLLLLGEREKTDHDIKLSAETLCQPEKRTGAKRLCCEEITLHASGSFVSELPSAALPLLVSDLTTFLWWRDALPAKNDKVFEALLRASDRLIVDSTAFVDPFSDLLALTKLSNNQDYVHVEVSDLNWARLTSWRALLAGFYDVGAYQPLLASVDEVRIDYLAPEAMPKSRQDAGAPSAAVAPQALLFAGWLASRLGWSLTGDQTVASNDEPLVFNFSTRNSDSLTKDRGGGPSEDRNRVIKVELDRVEHAGGKPGRLVQVELQSTTGQPASFAVSRSADNLHLTTKVRVKAGVQHGRVVPVRNRSAAQLLGREMEILCCDQIYQEALAMAASMIVCQSDFAAHSPTRPMTDDR